MRSTFSMEIAAIVAVWPSYDWVARSSARAPEPVRSVGGSPKATAAAWTRSKTADCAREVEAAAEDADVPDRSLRAATASSSRRRT